MQNKMDLLKFISVLALSFTYIFQAEGTVFIVTTRTFRNEQSAKIGSGVNGI